jgi:hypothetical protein
MNRFGFKGQFRIMHYREQSLINTYVFDNGVVDEGKDAILDVMFGGVAQSDPWYIGLIDNAGFSALDASDTMASHAGWAESVAYSDANRIEWADDAAASQSKTNSTTADFSINATASIYGMFLTSDNTKGGTTGTLWATSQFTSSPIPVVNLDTLKVVYTISVS